LVITQKYARILCSRLPLDFHCNTSYNSYATGNHSLGEASVRNEYGSDFLTIADDNGNEFELEVLSTIEYNGCNYLAVLPADADDSDPSSLQVGIIKSTEEDGEQILYTIEDESELEAVNNLIIESLYADQTDI